jgi:protein-disulfide isomerase
MTFRLGLVLGFVALCGCSNQSRAQGSAAKASAAKPGAAQVQPAKRDSTDPLSPRAMGSPTAPITVYEMSDFQCPFCRRHALETWPAIEREYVATGKVRWVFLNYPLTSLHPNAAAAAQFAMCAADAGKFWPVHDLLYQHQETWAPLKDPAPYLITLADSVGIPRDRMLACLQSPKAREAVEADAAGAARAGATSTPSFYIEGGMIAGAYPIGVFRQVLDSIYRVKTGK